MAVVPLAICAGIIVYLVGAGIYVYLMSAILSAPFMTWVYGGLLLSMTVIAGGVVILDDYHA